MGRIFPHAVRGPIMNRKSAPGKADISPHSKTFRAGMNPRKPRPAIGNPDQNSPPDFFVVHTIARAGQTMAHPGLRNTPSSPGEPQWHRAPASLFPLANRRQPGILFPRVIRRAWFETARAGQSTPSGSLSAEPEKGKRPPATSQTCARASGQGRAFSNHSSPRFFSPTHTQAAPRRAASLSHGRTQQMVQG